MIIETIGRKTKKKRYNPMLYKAKMVFVEDSEEKYKHLRFFCENYKSAKRVFGYNKKHKKILDTDEFKEFAEKGIEFVQIIPIDNST